jgi:(S)-2-hydroxyglutarate dehydrogenase
MRRVDIVIVGGGIVGLATAYALSLLRPKLNVQLLEKEGGVGEHQTGRNSGVIHTGVYYRPGSDKAAYATAGSSEMIAFCAREELPYEVCGKVIVATEAGELPMLAELQRRGTANGVALRRIGPAELREIEPHVHGIEALFVPGAAITSFRLVAERMARRAAERGVELALGTPLLGGRRTHEGVILETSAGELVTKTLVNCAGLHSDRVAEMCGSETGIRIVPFRGEYHELRAQRSHLVRGLVYPVPDPAFPFLGVHLTRMIDGHVHVGPNAVLAGKREGYDWRTVDFEDLREILTDRGFWRFARRHARAGVAEVHRSLRKGSFLRSVQRLLPEIGIDDLIPSPAGVRAQAMRPDGSLVDDFLIVEDPPYVHVCNAPSPAATSSLPIGRAIAARVVRMTG